MSTALKRFHPRFSSTVSSWYGKVLLLLLLIAVPAGLLVVIKEQVSALPCPCTMFTTPTGHGDFDDGSDLELGFKFQADISGYITGVRFYKQGAMSGTHVGNLWTSGGSNMATATFSSETASGWQEVTFGTPVAVTAGTTYVASVTMSDGRYIATTNYFTTERTNFPLRTPSSGSSGGNGVFSTSGGSFPTTSSNAANYWVDVSFIGNLGSSAPVVVTSDPGADETGVTPGDTVTATFDDAMDPTSITTSTFTMRDSSNAVVTGTVSYNNSTKTASFIADEGFVAGETYTATIEGGSGTIAANTEGVALAADHSWSFTASATNECPCSLQDSANPAGTSTFDETGGVELGTKITPLTSGYLTKLRFYKPITSTQTSRTLTVWSSTGTSLATATTSDESDYGWQEATLSSPLRVLKDQLYILSYAATDGIYVASASYHSSDKTNGYLRSYATGSSQNAATGSGNSNGVFTGTPGNYPSTGSSTGTYYWVDALFSTDSTPDDPLTVEVTQPTANAYGVNRNKPIRATFNRTLDSGTVINSTVRLFDSSNAPVSGAASYETATQSVVFTPSGSLDYNQRYTMRLSASIADQDGVTLGSEYSWSFTVGTALLSDINQGSGGPILIVTAPGNKYSTYYAEMLRTEGFNYFDVKDIGSVSATTLDAYDAVVLSEMTLTQTQADMFSDWVTTDGGNLVAMRPDDKLADLLGLNDVGTTRQNQYMLVDTALAPGQGIVNETIQFKGTADNYTLDGATAVATFYSDATTGTSNVAVATRTVGANGGTAASFAYDLAKSVIALHQGNQAWAGDNRDGVSPIRSNDIFFGAKAGDTQPDWVNLDKAHVPQADEQQRLLANILTEATKDRRPLPRFWYLPDDHKAAMVMGGDDHGLPNTTGTEKVFTTWLNESPTGCSVSDWECVRASDYNYESSGLTQSRALQFHNLEFEIANHPDNSCQNFSSYAALGTIFTNSMATWRSKYAGLPNQRTSRYHCYVWSDWDSMARVDYDNGIRYDLNYTTFPSSWIGTRPVIITGSGMNMRLTDADGDMLDVHQGVTNFENGVTGAAAIDTVLDNAIGSAGYYGIFGTHYDMSDSYHATLFAQAAAHDVPIISADQALTWLDGRNSSVFKDFGGGNGQFNFTVDAAMGAQGLRAMMPTADAGGTLTNISRNGSTLSYQTQTVKGVQYAVFDGSPGVYTVTYSDYDPDAGGTGDSSGSSSGGAGASPQKAATTKQGADTTGSGSETAEDEAQTPQKDKEPATDDRKDAEDEDGTTKTSKGDEGVPLGVWLGGIGLVAAVLVSLIFFWRKKRHSQITW